MRPYHQEISGTQIKLEILKPQVRPVNKYNLPQIICLMIPMGVHFNRDNEWYKVDRAAWNVHRKWTVDLCRSEKDSRSESIMTK